MQKPPGITNDGLFTFLNDMRLEIKGDIKDVKGDVSKLDDKVDTLQERVFTNETKESVTATKLVMLIGGISLVTSAIITVAVTKLLGS